VIRYLIALSTAAALFTAAGCSKPAAAPTPAHPNLSGSWVRPLGDREVGGLPPVNEIPLTPWAAAKFKAERPAAGENQDFANTTDPSLRYADPNGYPRISLHPMRFKLVQTDDYVYQLWEYNQNWRQIALNVPQDPDPALTWYGNAVGKWEGDTLVVDSVGSRTRRGSTHGACRTRRISTSSSASIAWARTSRSTSRSRILARSRNRGRRT